MQTLIHFQQVIWLITVRQLRLSVIFSPGNYTVTLEVTGVDFDNLFLPVPLKFEFPVSINS
jgi:hypothetical protein